MKVSKPTVKIAGLLGGVVAVILLLVPLHAFLTVWLASLVGHYTIVRLWKEFLLLFLLLGSIGLLVKVPSLRWKLISYKLHWFIAGYALAQVVWGIVSLMVHQVTFKALAYGWLSNLRFLLFFLVVWAIATEAPKLAKQWPRWVVWPLVIVVAVGLLQYFVLPYDAFKHVGYNESTIFPYETINHDVNQLRIMSTLRGANPLGAYLVLTLSLLAVLWHKQRRVWQTLLFAAGLLVLYLSFSRSAWIGLVLSLGVVAWVTIKSKRSKQMALSIAAGLIVVAGVLGLTLRNSATFQNVLFHTNDHSKITVSSNEGHASALHDGIMDLLHNPLGRGPGTAGPASVYNNHPARISENYFIQIGQETGWIGLLLFAAINLVVGRALWRRREQTLALGLVAALIGLTFVNLLSHAWADDTLAYLWWGLAGIAIATKHDAKDEI